MPIPEVARYYVDTLEAEGFLDITVSCIPNDLDPSTLDLVSVRASQWVTDFELTGSVSIDPSSETIGPPVYVAIFVHAPFHTDDGDKPAGDPPDVSCLDPYTA